MSYVGRIITYMHHNLVGRIGILHDPISADEKPGGFRNRVEEVDNHFGQVVGVCNDAFGWPHGTQQSSPRSYYPPLKISILNTKSWRFDSVKR